MSVGAQLRRARDEQKLSIADVTKSTKIQPWVIEALEGDRLHEQMSPIYVKGFLTSYAKFLRLDAAALVSQLPFLQPALEAPEEANAPESTAAIPSAVKFTLPKIEFPKIALPKLSFPNFSLPEFSLARLRQAGAALALTALVFVIMTGRADRWMPKPLALSRLAAPKVASVTPIKSVTKPQPVSLPELTVTPTQPLELVVSASKTTWIRLRVDGKLLAQQRLERGTSERWVAKKRFDMVLAKPSEVDVTLNGQSMTPFAIAHQGRLAITHQGITELPEGAM